VFLAAINQNGELDFARSAEIHQLIHRGANRSAGV